MTPEQEEKPIKKSKRQVLVKEEKPVYLTYEDFPVEDLYLYAGIDCLVTSGLASKAAPLADIRQYYKKYIDIGGKPTLEKVAIPSVLDTYMETTSIALDFIIDLEINGIQYDIDLNKELNNRMIKEIEELESLIFSGIGKVINLNSGDVVRAFLYEEKGFKAESFTKTGEPSTDGDAVKTLAKAYPEESWLPLLAKRNDIASLHRMFISTYVEDFVKSDGRIHPSYNLHGTGSFRISGEEPNLTQISNTKHGYNIRECYTVPEGYVFIAADYSGCEIKVLNALCTDEGLSEAIRLGRDFHSVSACAMYNLDYEEFVSILNDENNPLYREYKGKRQISKALTFN